MSEERAAQLRREFDATFAVRPPASVPTVELLSIGVGDVAMALRVSDLVSVHRAGRIQPLPGAPIEMLGLAGIRGRIVPVYDLSALLGRPCDRPPIWLALTGAPIVGLAFDRLEGQLRVSEGEVVAATAGERFVHSVATIAGVACAILDLRATTEEIRRRVPARGVAP